jgi:hypothetical protein
LSRPEFTTLSAHNAFDRSHRCGAAYDERLHAADRSRRKELRIPEIPDSTNSEPTVFSRVPRPKFRFPESFCNEVKRVWFYLTAPFSCISYVCEIDTAVTRNHEGDDPKLPEDGLGNKEYNTFHIDWEGYDFAYRVRSVYEIIEPITLAKMKSRYGCKGAPRGLIYLPEGIANDVPWKSQKCIIPDDHRESG